MSFPKYEKYKDSGVEWLEEVPEHWNTSKFGFLKTVLTDYTANGSFADLKKNVRYLSSPGYARLVRLTDLRQGLNNHDGVWISKPAYEYLSKSALYGGEFLLANVGAYAGLFYQMPYNSGLASLAPNMFMAKFDPLKAHPKFISWVAISKSASEQLKLLATSSSAQPKLNKDDFKSVVVVIPPLFEQTQIARFLEYETARIDALIAEQERLIALLKEKRQAVISHAVTKGCDPSVPMKDSGDEWLGEVPDHWEVKKVNYACDIHNNLRTPIDRNIRAQKDGPYPYYGPTGVLDYIDEFYVEGEYFLLGEDGDHFLKFNDKPMTINVDGKFCVNNHAHLMKGKAGCSTSWAALCFETRDLAPWLIKQGVARYKLRKEILASIQIAVPPLSEQISILKDIAGKKVMLNKLISRAKESINLLQERRSALISAAVTGKIDVRNWQPPTSTPPMPILEAVHS